MKKNKGFTLIELLVVITIIGILMSILLPAVGAAFKKAKESRVNTEVRAIEAAVKAYLQEYGKFPMQTDSNGDKAYLDSAPTHKDLISVLRGQDVKDKSGKSANAKGILFLEVSEKSLGTEGTKEGKFLDPWEEPYYITCDWDFNNIVNTHTGRNVVVWSEGSGEQIGSWQ
ncbi:MAG: type II secretion system protein [Kiritimatiellia bacterium]